MTHVDLLPAFERHPARSLQVGILDAHPNELAHRLAAAEIAPALSKLVGTLPPGRGPVADQSRP